MKFIFCIVSVSLIAHSSCFRDVHRRLKAHHSVVDPGQPLILTPLIEANKIQEARNTAQVRLRGVESVRSYSGFFTVNKLFNSNMFFWFFPSQSNYQQDPVILWLEGGPGATSLIGLFLEHGPFTIKKRHGLRLREFSWVKNHSVIYIDNPVGTGYSFTNGGYAQNETAVGKDLYAAVTQFFQLFPELQRNKFFIAGGSYAGKYVPALGYTIHRNNPTAKIKINLIGLSIENGLCDPETQVYYDDLMYQLGLIDLNEKRQMREIEERGVDYIRKKQWNLALRVFDELVDGDLSGYPSFFRNTTGFGTYYNFLISNDTSIDTNYEYMASFVQKADVRAAIHVGNTSFDEDARIIEANLLDDIMQSVAPWISELLSHYRVLFYNGQLDIIGAYSLTLNFLQNLKFSAAEEYKSAKRRLWYVNGVLAGYEKNAGNLTEVLVRNAGHLVSVQQPKWSLDLITRFTRRN